jgi:hypothetical protein
VSTAGSPGDVGVLLSGVLTVLVTLASQGYLKHFSSWGIELPHPNYLATGANNQTPAESWRLGQGCSLFLGAGTFAMSSLLKEDPRYRWQDSGHRTVWIPSSRGGLGLLVPVSLMWQICCLVPDPNSSTGPQVPLARSSGSCS